MPTAEAWRRYLQVDLGAEVKDIKIKVEGAKEIRLTDSGELLVESKSGVVKFSKPVAYQEKEGKKEYVSVSYNITGKDVYGFETGEYDMSLPLVIDPALTYSTYLGGTVQRG